MGVSGEQASPCEGTRVDNLWQGPRCAASALCVLSPMLRLVRSAPSSRAGRARGGGWPGREERSGGFQGCVLDDMPYQRALVPRRCTGHR